MTTGSRPISLSLAEIQDPVRRQLDAVIAEMVRMMTSDLDFINEVGTHLQQMKGKLLRPTLLLLSHEASQGEDGRLPTLGAIVELIHVATLVHDDSVDHSALRRGLPTVNAQFSHQIAVIMGDYLYSRAVIELAKLRDPVPLDVLARVTNEMTVGEMRQLQSFDRLAFDEDDYDALIGSKTAALFSGACEVGGLRAPLEQREALRRFGWALGMGFQIVDDVLDYTQTEDVTGKPSGLDLKEHKVTLPLIAALRTADPSGRGVVSSLFETPEPSSAQIAEVVAIVKEFGGFDYAMERARTFMRTAEGALDALPPSPGTDSLRGCVAYAVERQR